MLKGVQKLFLPTSEQRIKKSIMRFAVKSNGPQYSRLGNIDCLDTISYNQNIETPVCLIYTRAGSVPHLTFEVLQLLFKEKFPMVFPLPTIVKLRKAVGGYGKGIGEFVGLSEYPVYISVQDPAVATPSGYNDKTGVSLWSSSGRVHLDVDKFMKSQAVFAPHWYQALCDSDTYKFCSKKRLTHSVERSLVFLDQCLEWHNQCERLNKTEIFGTVQGGYDLAARKKSAQETALRPVFGFVIDGFYPNGAEIENSDIKKIDTLLEETIKLLPHDKPRLMHGALPPDAILNAVKCGIDIFDSSFPYIVTERNNALVFPFTQKQQLDYQNCISTNDSQSKFEINLSDIKYESDFSPLVSNCTCYACQKFTCAYIHHLLKNSEMLAPVLLIIHNIHHYLEFFSAVREALRNDTLRQLEHIVNGSILEEELKSNE